MCGKIRWTLRVADVSQHKKGGWRILLSGTNKKADICHNAAKGRSWMDFASSLPDKLLRNGD